jgi:hypothetical protein
MTLSGFISKLNWRLVMVHLLACWFFYYAAGEFWILIDAKFLLHLLSTSFKGNYDAIRIEHDLMWMNLAELSSILIAFAISLVIVIRKKWFWLNSVLMLTIAIALIMLWARFKIGFTPWHYLKQIFLTPGSIFDNTIWFFVINGLLLLTVGLCLFFLKPIIRFIEGKKVHKAPLNAEGQVSDYELEV